MSILIKEHKPSKNLSPFVELYWAGSFNANASERLSMQIIPNGCLELIFHLNDLHCDLYNDHQWSQSPDYLIIGLFTQPYEVQFKGPVKAFSIRFKPEGLYNIFGVPASLLKGRYEDITAVLDGKFHNFCHRLREEKSVAGMIRRTENYLLKNLAKRKLDKNYVNLAAEIIRNSNGIKMEELSDKVCISQRHLEREFKDKIGISPKHYLRITRINEVLQLLNNNQTMDLLSVTHQCGYFDQAHFIKDFKKITGKNPTIFVKEGGQVIGNIGLTYSSVL